QAAEAAPVQGPVTITVPGDAAPHQMSLFGEAGGAGAATAEKPAPNARRSTVAALAVPEDRIKAGVPPQVYIVKTAKALQDLAGLLRRAGRFTVDVETTSAEEMDAQLVGISIAPPTEAGDVQAASYIPVGHLEAPEDGPPRLDKSQLPLDTVRKLLGPVLLDPAVLKDAHNAKYAQLVLRRGG